MTIVRYAFTCILVILSLSAFCQRADSSVFLKWKLKPGEVLIYKTEMRIVKDTSSGVSSYFDKVFKNFPISTKDSSNKFQVSDSWMNQMRKQMDESPSYLTTITQKGAAINVEMVIKGNDSSKSNFASLAKLFDTSAMKHTTSSIKRNTSTKKRNPSSIKPDTIMNSFFRSAMFMMRRVMLRGAINEDGSVNSFYVNKEQRNLLGLFFGLPGKPVKVGDFWPVDVHLVTADQNFICDSSSRENKATVTNIANENGQHVVTVKYDIKERIVGTTSMPFGGGSEKTSQSATYEGTARFSIEQGRWIFYDCQLSENIGGVVTSQKVTKYTLSE